ncbi:MAG: histidinol-phosphate transaminase [Proteobacteria bacterium]|nr:histidinol-phosphate transaminase [Pseudomonadota bacterium]
MIHPSSLIPVKQPTSEDIQRFFPVHMQPAKTYAVDALDGEIIKLNQNESPYDWPLEIKERVCKKLLSQSWNTYPPPYPLQLEHHIANLCGVEKGSVLAVPGSSRLLDILMSYLGLAHKSRWVILSPSFALYEHLAQSMGLKYIHWPLESDFSFSLDTLPSLCSGDVVLLATPNNPTGTQLSYDMLNNLVSRYPEVLWVCDSAYYEYSDQPYEKLLKQHSNLVIMKTFSKSFGAAGLRFGYLLAAKPYIERLRVGLLPFSFNHLSLLAIEEVLSDPHILESFQSHSRTVTCEREKMYQNIKDISLRNPFDITPSKANFLFLYWQDFTECKKVYETLKKDNILARMFTHDPTIKASMRVSIGTPQHNELFVKSLSRIYSP